VIHDHMGVLGGQNASSWATPVVGAYIYDGTQWTYQPTVASGNTTGQGSALKTRIIMTASGHSCEHFYLFTLEAGTPGTYALYRGKLENGVVSITKLNDAPASTFYAPDDIPPMLFFDKPKLETCEKPPLPAPLTHSGIDDSKLYFLDPDGTRVFSRKTITKAYDALTDPTGSYDMTWAQSPAFALNEDNGIGFIFGGYSTSSSNTTNNVTRVGLQRGTQTPSLYIYEDRPDRFSARQSAAATASGPYAYLSGGHDKNASNVQNDVWRCDTQNCVGLQTTIISRSVHAMVAYNNKIWVIGGRDATPEHIQSVQSMSVDPSDPSDSTNRTWSEESSLPNPLAFHAAVVMKGHIIVLGGHNTSEFTAPFVGAYIYNGSQWREQHTIESGDTTWGGSLAHSASTMTAGGQYCEHFYLFTAEKSSSSAVLYQGNFENGVVSLTKLTEPTAFTSHDNVYPMFFFDRPKLATCETKSVPSGTDANLMFLVPDNTAVYYKEGTAIDTLFTSVTFDNQSITWADKSSFVTANEYAYVFAGKNTQTFNYSKGVVVLDLHDTNLIVHGHRGVDDTETNAGFPARIESASAAIGNNAYVMGGITSSGDVMKDVWMCTPAVCSNLNQNITEVHGHAMIDYNGRLWIIGGMGANKTKSAVVTSMPSDGTTKTTENPLPAALVYHGAVVVRSHIVVMGGTDDNNLPFKGAYIFNGSHWRNQSVVNVSYVDGNLVPFSVNNEGGVYTTMVPHGKNCGRFYLWTRTDVSGTQTYLLYEGDYDVDTNIVTLHHAGQLFGAEFERPTRSPMLYFHEPSKKACSSSAPIQPTQEPTQAPILEPTQAPTRAPTTLEPTTTPTIGPTPAPTTPTPAPTSTASASTTASSTLSTSASITAISSASTTESTSATTSASMTASSSLSTSASITAISSASTTESTSATTSASMTASSSLSTSASTTAASSTPTTRAPPGQPTTAPTTQSTSKHTTGTNSLTHSATPKTATSTPKSQKGAQGKSKKKINTTEIILLSILAFLALVTITIVIYFKVTSTSESSMKEFTESLL